MATKSVLSQSANLQSGSALALGALMNKPKAGAKKREGSAERASSDAGSSADQSGSMDRSKKADATKSVLSNVNPSTSEAARALGALNSSKKGGATKSVLSQAPQSSSAAAQALGALNQKKSEPKALGALQNPPAARHDSPPASSSGSAVERESSAQRSADTSSVPPASDASRTLGALQGQRGGATKSVLSLAPGSTSAAAKALGSLGKQPKAGSRADATKSVLSQASQPKSAAAQALGGAVAKHSPPHSQDTSGQVTAESSQPASPRADPWVSASMPTRAEAQSRNAPISDASTPLIHPDDEYEVPYNNRLVQDIRVETQHDTGAKQRWACCSASTLTKVDLITAKNDIISRPKQTYATYSSHHQLQESEKVPKSFLERYLTFSYNRASAQCGTCTKEFVQEIAH